MKHNLFQEFRSWFAEVHQLLARSNIVVDQEHDFDWLNYWMEGHNPKRSALEYHNFVHNNRVTSPTVH